MAKHKWIQSVARKIEKKGTAGALHKQLGVPEDKPIPVARLEAIKARLGEKENLTEADRKLLHRVMFALNARGK